MPISFADKLARIPHYEAGATSVEAAGREAAGDVAQLASNESPYAPVAEVVEALQRAAKEVNRYPDPGARALKLALSKRYDFDPGRIAVGNGSCEILLAAAEALLEPGGRSCTRGPRSRCIRISPRPRARTRRRSRSRLGRCTTSRASGSRSVSARGSRSSATRTTRRQRTSRRPQSRPSSRRCRARILVILDEAYVEFQVVEDPDATLDLLERFPNLVVLRTFSKVYGLAGLRVGYALGSEEFRQAVDRVRQPFAVNHLAQTAATEALRHQDDVARRVERNAIERLWVADELERIGLAATESQANFCWIALGDREEAEVVNGLARRGVAVRAGAGLGAPGHIRVSYGTRGENERFVIALEEILADTSAR